MNLNNKPNHPFYKLGRRKETGVGLSIISGVLLMGAVVMINIDHECSERSA